jgi:hypothetical protein
VRPRLGRELLQLADRDIRLLVHPQQDGGADVQLAVPDLADDGRLHFQDAA